MNLDEEILVKTILEYDYYDLFYKSYLIHQTGYSYKKITKFIQKLLDEKIIIESGIVGKSKMYKVIDKEKLSKV